MFTNLKPYPAYAESGITWLGQAPAHWRVHRVKSLVRERVTKDHPDESLLAATQSRGVIRKSDYGTRTVTAQKDLHLLKLVEVGDFVISLRSFQGGIERAYDRGIISPAYTVLHLHDIQQRDYLTLLFKSRPFVEGLTLCVTGIREGQNVDYVRLSRDGLAVPPADEQAAIVKYLGHANARIDRAIAAKRRLIALLEEQKGAIINQAVTRGLDPAVSLRDSGIPWLGQIPQHWNVRRAKYLFRDIDARSETGLEEQLSVSHLTGVSPSRFKNITMFKAASYVGHKTCMTGDLVVNTMWAWMGALGIARETGLVSPAYNVYRPLRAGINVDFVAALFRTPTYIAYFRSHSTGVRASRLRFYPDELLATPVVMPPANEQAAIVEVIEGLSGPIATELKRVVREIELLQEFRTRLTADVVTGQLDIRDAAARLPELDPADLVSDVIEQDEDDLEAELAASLEEVDA